MLVRKVVIWWLTTGIKGPALTDEDKRISSLTPLLEALFPGINYYSVTGFSEAMKERAVPVLNKLFPEFQSGPAGHVAASDEVVEISEFLPSNGYEWQDSEEWKGRFDALLSA